jgi:hypothetical protein
MRNLTEEQKAVLLYVGSDDHDEPYLPRAVLEELRSLGLLIRQSNPGRYDLSDEGQRVYFSMASLIC